MSRQALVARADRALDAFHAASRQGDETELLLAALDLVPLVPGLLAQIKAQDAADRPDRT